MIWVARYTKKKTNGVIILEQIGNFACGNGREVIEKVCAIQGIATPDCDLEDCRCEFKTSPNKDEEEVHTIVVCSLGKMIDIRG